MDSPETIYHCPLDRRGLSLHWTDENCYWSAGYAEAREKFVSLGNALREQVRSAGEGGRELKVLDVLSLSYEVARGDFPEYLSSLEATDVSSSQAISPGKDTVDALLLTLRVHGGVHADREGVDVVHSSGTHGAEGYAGSAVQIRFLHELFMQNEKQHAENLDGPPSSSGYITQKVLLIHSVNPYGMRHHRRTNENNVDLNRNVLSEEMWRDTRKQDPNHAGYVDMDSIMNPFKPIDKNGKLFSWVDEARRGGFEGDVMKLRRQDEKVKNTLYPNDSHTPRYTFESYEESTNLFNSWMTEKKDILRTIKNCIGAIITLGYTGAKRGLVSSQRHKQSGVFYGGGAHNNDTWENSIFSVQHAILEFASLQPRFSSGRMIWIDVHTGLGKYGEYSILTTGDNSKQKLSSCNNNRIDRSGGPRDDAWISKFKSLLEESGMGYGTSGDPGVSAGYDLTNGFVNDRVLCKPPHCFPVTQEFGTRPAVAVAISLILENRAYHSASRRYGHLTSWAFYPQRLSWRRKILRGGMHMLHAVLDF